MSAIEQLEAAGEVLSPAVRAVIFALEARVAAFEAPVRAEVTEHRLLRLACPGCGARNRAALPAEPSAEAAAYPLFHRTLVR